MISIFPYSRGSIIFIYDDAMSLVKLTPESDCLDQGGSKLRGLFEIASRTTYDGDHKLGKKLSEIPLVPLLPLVDVNILIFVA